MIEERHGHDDLEPRLGTLQILELAAPGRVVARRELHLACYRLLRVGDIAADIAVAKIDIDVGGELRILGADAGWPLREAHLGDLAERHRAAVRQGRDQHLAGDGLGVAAVVAGIADADGVALAALDGGGHRLRRRAPWRSRSARRPPSARSGRVAPGLDRRSGNSRRWPVRHRRWTCPAPCGSRPRSAARPCPSRPSPCRTP